jgi:hypothetical protein
VYWDVVYRGLGKIFSFDLGYAPNLRYRTPVEFPLSERTNPGPGKEWIEVKSGTRGAVGNTIHVYEGSGKKY